MIDAPRPLEPHNAQLAAVFSTPQALLALAYDESNQRLYGAGLDGALHSVDVSQVPATTPSDPDQKPDDQKPDDKKRKTTPAEKKWPLHGNYVSSLVLNGGTLISASYDRSLAWWNVATGERLRSVPAHDGWVRKAALLPGREQLVSVGDDMLVKIWNSQSGECLATLAGHARQSPQGFATALYALAVHPTGSFIATADRAGVCFIWDVTTRDRVTQFTAAEFYTYDAVKRARSIGGIRALAFSPDGTRLAISGIGQVTNVDGFVGPCRLEIWDWQSARRDYAGQGKHQAIQNDVRFGPSPWIVTAGGGDGGGDLAFWNPAEAAPIHLVKPEGHVHQLALRSDGRQIFTAGHGGFQAWHLP